MILLHCNNCGTEHRIGGWESDQKVERLERLCDRCGKLLSSTAGVTNRSVIAGFCQMCGYHVDSAGHKRACLTVEQRMAMGKNGALGEATARASMPAHKVQVPGVCDGCGTRVQEDSALRCRHCKQTYWSCEPCNVNRGCIDCVGRRGVDAFMRGLEEGLSGRAPDPTAADARELSEWAEQEGVDVRMWEKRRPRLP